MRTLARIIHNLMFRPTRQNIIYLSPCVSLPLKDDPSLYNPANNTHFQCGDPTAIVYRDAVFWPTQSIAAKNNAIIKNTFIDDKGIKIIKRRNKLRSYPILRHKGWATSIDYIYSRANYYHQFVDSMPRVWALRHPYLSDKTITIFLARHLDKDQEELLHLLIPKNVIIKRVSRFVRIHADYYVHLPFLSKDRIDYNPSSTLTSAGFIPNEYLTEYRRLAYSLISHSPKNNSQDILILRGPINKRKIINEKEVVSFLQNEGFDPIVPQNHSLQSQVEIFGSARLIIAQMGAALTNLLYAQEGGGLLEINHGSSHYQHFSLHCKVLGMEYDEMTLGGKDINTNMVIPIKELSVGLNRLRKKLEYHTNCQTL